MSDLDKSRRCGVPTNLQPHLNEPSPSTSPDNGISSSSIPSTSYEIASNGWHPDSQDGVEQLQQQRIIDQELLSSCHSPIHDDSRLQFQSLSVQMQPQQETKIAQEIQPSSTKDLDGPISGLQAAAAKTALVLDGKAVRKDSLDAVVVTMEEDEDDEHDQHFHWIFHKHVGFSTPTMHYRPQHLQQHAIQSSHASPKTSNGIYQQTKPSHSIETLEFLESQENLTAYQKEKAQLLEQLISLRKQRHRIQQYISPIVQQHLNEWNHKLSTAQHSHQNAKSKFNSLISQRKSIEEEHTQAIKWHVLGDVFFVWHRGPFGTINGMRLGRTALTMAGLVKKFAGSGNVGGGNSASGNTVTSVAGGGGVGHSSGSNAISSTSSFFSWGNSENGTAGRQEVTAPTNNSNNQNPSPEKAIVPWTEINSALGQIVFLLHTIQHIPFSNITFRKHILQPCGSASKIGFYKKHASATAPTAEHPHGRRRITALASYCTPQQASINKNTHSETTNLSTLLPRDVTWYNLQHYEENGSLLSMGYYARRNFNTALEGLLYCIAEAFLVIEKRDMALAAPYVICAGGLVVGVGANNKLNVGGSSSGGEATVGGLPLAYDPAEGERWTMVCRYLLTNVKWLIAYVAKHVDR